MSTESEYAQALDLDRIKDLFVGDASLDVLLERLKQSTSTAEEFAKFIKKKAIIEDDHYNQMKKFGSQARMSIKNLKVQKSAFTSALDQIIEFDEKLYSVGSSYVKALTVMYDELTSLVNTVARSRKMIKEDGKRREKECLDAIAAAEKAKQKYYHLCDDLEKLRSDPNKKLFSLKNRLAIQQEDELQRKIDAADQDYKLKVNTCKKLKDELTHVHRPTNSKKLKNLILELEIAMNVQLQKYTTWSENLILHSGVMIMPLQAGKPSMKTISSSIDNEKDLYEYLLKNESTMKRQTLVPVAYTVHSSFQRNMKLDKPFLNNRLVSANLGVSNTPEPNHSPSPMAQTQTPQNQLFSLHLNLGLSTPQYENKDVGYNSLDPGNAPTTLELKGPKSLTSQLRPSQPTFGVSIEDVIQFAGIDNVPLVVRRCIEMIETYGIDIEGIYRTSGNASTVQQMKEKIDQDFTNYVTIGQDIDPDHVVDGEVYCIALLLKLYFSCLPEPLLTAEYYQSFIETVKSLDETFIAKKLHHLVYNLPDGAYFTLRAIMFHLNKVAAHQATNRMSAKSLSIIWGPALLNDNSLSPQDLSYKSKVVEELMLIANEIFDTEDE